MTRRQLALDPPQEDIALITTALVDEVVQQSRQTARGRMIAPLHRSDGDTVHRMLNAIQPGSYVRPHRHLDPPKPEAWIVLQGRLLFVAFHDDGAIDQHMVLGAQSNRFGADVVPGRYHTIVALEPDTVNFEVKAGPYDAATDKAFAPWAPAEGTQEAQSFLADVLTKCGQ